MICILNILLLYKTYWIKITQLTQVILLKLKYFVYTASFEAFHSNIDPDVDFELFKEINNVNGDIRFTTEEFYKYGYRGDSVEGPPPIPRNHYFHIMSHISVVKKPKRNGIPSYTIDDIVHGFSEDLRSFEETFHKYGTILCSDIHEKGNVVLQDLIDHLGRTRHIIEAYIVISTEQIIMKESPYIVSDSSYNIGPNLSSDNTRVSIDNMKYYIMLVFIV